MEGLPQSVLPLVENVPVLREKKNGNLLSSDDEKKKDERNLTSSTNGERPEDVRKKGLVGNSLKRLGGAESLFTTTNSCSPGNESKKGEDRISTASEDRLTFDKDFKKKGIIGNSMKRLNSGTLLIGSSSFQGNGDPLGPLGNDLHVPRRIFMRSNGNVIFRNYTNCNIWHVICG